MDPLLQIVIEVMLGVLVTAVGFIVRRLSSDIEKFTTSLADVAKKISEVELEMIKLFVLKEELVPIKNRLFELPSREDMTLLRAQVQKMAGEVTALMTRADLQRRNGEK